MNVIKAAYLMNILRHLTCLVTGDFLNYFLGNSVLAMTTYIYNPCSMNLKVYKTVMLLDAHKVYYDTQYCGVMSEGEGEMRL